MTLDELATLAPRLAALERELQDLKASHNQAPTEPVLVSVDTAARLLDSPVPQVRKWCKSGALDARRDGKRKLLITYESVRALPAKLASVRAVPEGKLRAVGGDEIDQMAMQLAMGGSKRRR